MLVTSFVGRNKDFRTWLAAQKYPNVVSLAEYREKRKTARKRPYRKLLSEL